MLTERQIEIILEIGFKLNGKSFNDLNCASFVKMIYKVAGIHLRLVGPKNCRPLSFSEIFKKEALGYLMFFHRKKTKTTKRITHMGIIFPSNQVLHYSRWMNGEPGFYKVFLSSFEEVFEVYDFVGSDQLKASQN